MNLFFSLREKRVKEFLSKNYDITGMVCTVHENQRRLKRYDKIQANFGYSSFHGI